MLNIRAVLFMILVFFFGINTTVSSKQMDDSNGGSSRDIKDIMGDKGPSAMERNIEIMRDYNNSEVNNETAKKEIQEALKTFATKAARPFVGAKVGEATGKAVGTKIGEIIGKAVKGGPLGAAAGVILSPTEIGLDPGEQAERDAWADQKAKAQQKQK